MPAPRVPPVDDSGAEQPVDSGKFEQIELRILDANAKSKEKLNDEADQRYWLRWISIGLCIVVILFMAGMIYSTSGKMVVLTGFGASSAFLIALYVSPIISISTITIAILIAAFRGFKEGDERSGLSQMGENARTIGIIE